MALLDRAQSGEPTRSTEDVAVALEVARLAVASQEPDSIRFHLLLEAATSLSVAAEAAIRRIQQRQWPYAPAGSQEWIEFLLAAIDLVIEVRGSSTELDTLRRQTTETLSRSVHTGS